METVTVSTHAEIILYWSGFLLAYPGWVYTLFFNDSDNSLIRNHFKWKHFGIISVCLNAVSVYYSSQTIMVKLSKLMSTL